MGIGKIGIDILRTRESFFTFYVQKFLPTRTLQQDTNIYGWQAWINARLPEPEEKKELKKALDKAYPPSKWRTLSGLIVIGAGGWILLTVISAVIQWFVEKGLNKFFS